FVEEHRDDRILDLDPVPIERDLHPIEPRAAERRRQYDTERQRVRLLGIEVGIAAAEALGSVVRILEVRNQLGRDALGDAQRLDLRSVRLAASVAADVTGIEND